MKKELKDYMYLYAHCDMWVTRYTPRKFRATEMFAEIEEQYANIEYATLEHEKYESKLGCYKLILRSLSDWSLEEQDEYKQIHIDHIPTFCGDQLLYAKYTKHLIDKGFDLFGLIDAGLAIDKKSIK